MDKGEMLESVLNYMSYFGDVDERVIDAMDRVDRKRFYPFGEEAYSDIPIETHGTIISQPSTVGRMLSLLKLEVDSKCLEVGTGSGWNACLLANIVNLGSVLSLEIHEQLVDFARKNSSDFGLEKNLRIENRDYKDVTQKFDRIIFTCGIDKGDENEIISWVGKHLNDKGRAVIPHVIGKIIVLEKKSGKIKINETREEYSFVPLI